MTTHQNDYPGEVHEIANEITGVLDDALGSNMSPALGALEIVLTDLYRAVGRMELSPTLNPQQRMSAQHKVATAADALYQARLILGGIQQP